MGEQINCVLHDKELKELKEDMGKIRDNVHTLLGRQNDIIVKVVNGKTESRLASELIGEMYIAIKELKQETPKSIFNNFATFADNAFKIITLIALHPSITLATYLP